MFPPGYIDAQNISTNYSRPGQGTGLGLGGPIARAMEQQNVYNSINFSLAIPHVSNTTASRTALTVFQCPSDGYQQPVVLYDSTFSNPIATVAHSNYFGVCGWEECFMNATGNPQPFYGTTTDASGDSDGDPADGLYGSNVACTFGAAGVGMFYRNSNTRIANVTDGLSNTMIVGERCAAHAPLTWAGADRGGQMPRVDGYHTLDVPLYSSLRSARIPATAPPMTTRTGARPCASATAATRTCPIRTTRSSTPIRSGRCTRAVATRCSATARCIS